MRQRAEGRQTERDGRSQKVMAKLKFKLIFVRMLLGFIFCLEGDQTLT